MVFRGHFPHAAPVVQANWQTRWVVYLGYFTSDIDKVEESLHFEADVRGLSTGNWKMGKPSCCHSVWDWAPQPFDPGPAMLNALKQASKGLSVEKEMILEQAKQEASRVAMKATQADMNLLHQAPPSTGRRSARKGKTETEDQCLPASPEVTVSERPAGKDSIAKFEIDAMLERLKALSADHFETSPDEINWGHVGTLNHYASLLRQITDIAFKEGEHAA